MFPFAYSFWNGIWFTKKQNPKIFQHWKRVIVQFSTSSCFSLSPHWQQWTIPYHCFANMHSGNQEVRHRRQYVPVHLIWSRNSKRSHLFVGWRSSGAVEMVTQQNPLYNRMAHWEWIQVFYRNRCIWDPWKFISITNDSRQCAKTRNDSLAFIKPDRFESLQLQRCHNDIYIVIAKSQYGSMWIYPFAWRQLFTNFIQFGLGEGSWSWQ